MALRLHACATVLALLRCCAPLLTLPRAAAFTYTPPRPALGLRAPNRARPAPRMSSTPTSYRVRECKGSEDYSAVIGSVDSWWGERTVSPMLPRLFFENFSDTTFMVTTTAAVCDPEKSTTQPAHQEQPTATTTDQGGGREIIVGFLCGLVSQAKVGEAHAHFIGIHPDHRGAGLGARLYEHFFRAVKARGCTLVHAVTSPVNIASVEFHTAIGFEAVPVASSGGEGEDGAGAGETGSKAGALSGSVAGGRRGSEVGRAEKGAPVGSEFVHVNYDGPADGDRVVMEKRL